jgi:hypothetical protein
VPCFDQLAAAAGDGLRLGEGVVVVVDVGPRDGASSSASAAATRPVVVFMAPTFGRSAAPPAGATATLRRGLSPSLTSRSPRGLRKPRCRGYGTASQLASEAMALIESVGDPTLTVGLSVPVVYAKVESAEWPDVLRWSQRLIDLADGDPSRGNLIVGSPLALALTTRAMARYCLGRAGWRDDMHRGLAMARSANPMSYATAVALVYNWGIPYGVLRPDDSAVREIENAVRIAERSGDDLALSNARAAVGLALVYRQTGAVRDRGQKLMTEVSEVFLRRGHNLSDLPIVNVYLARERVRRGDGDDAIALMRAAVDHLFREGQLLVWGVPATGVLVETLLDGGADGDVVEAEAAIERFAAVPADEGLVIREIWLLRLRALLAKAHGDDTGYREFRDRYRDMARTLGFDGHISWAEAMP